MTTRTQFDVLSTLKVPFIREKVLFNWVWINVGCIWIGYGLGMGLFFSISKTWKFILARTFQSLTFYSHTQFDVLSTLKVPFIRENEEKVLGAEHCRNSAKVPFIREKVRFNWVWINFGCIWRNLEEGIGSIRWVSIRCCLNRQRNSCINCHTQFDLLSTLKVPFIRENEEKVVGAELGRSSQKVPFIRKNVLFNFGCVWRT